VDSTSGSSILRVVKAAGETAMRHAVSRYTHRITYPLLHHAVTSRQCNVITQVRFGSCGNWKQPPVWIQFVLYIFQFTPDASISISLIPIRTAHRPRNARRNGTSTQCQQRRVRVRHFVPRRVCAQLCREEKYFDTLCAYTVPCRIDVCLLQSGIIVTIGDSASCNY